MSEPEAVGVILGFESSEPPPAEKSPIVPHPIPPFPTLMPTRCVDAYGVSKWDTDNISNVIGWEENGEFKFVGWSYEREPAKTAYCLMCGNDKFLVGSNNDALLTILKCPECGWERVIHEG